MFETAFKRQVGPSLTSKPATALNVDIVLKTCEVLERI